MIEKPKKERRFLKAMGRVGEILIEQVLIKVGSSLIKKIGGKKTLPSILFLLASLSLFAQFPNTGNKQRLGFQTTGDGLVWRGSLGDTASIQPINNQNAWVILDTVNLKIYSFDFTSNVWNLVGGGSAAFEQPVDSLFFKTSVPTNNVDTAKMRWDSDLGTVVLGMYDQVPNELGFKNFWLVKNQTGSTITKGSIVYANGTVGASGRITVDKFIADGSIESKYVLGITAHDLTDGEDGYVISYGKIRQVNTDAFAAGAILYPSPTTAGVWTDVEPVAPNIDMPIGFCINSSSNNGTIAIRVASGYKLSELHDVAITSPVNKASLYYSGGLWRDTTAALLVSDTSNMLTPYLRKLDTISLSNRINLKLNISDTAAMLTPYFRDADTTSLNLTSRFAAKLNISDTASMLTNYLRTGIAASTYQTKLSGTGFVKASGTTISYDNSSYLRTGLADSTYLKLTGGTLTGGLTGTTALFSGNVAIGFPFAYKPFEVLSNANDFVSVGVRNLEIGQFSGIHFGYVEPNTDYRKSAIVFQRRDYTGGFDASGSIHLLNVSQGQGGRSADLRDAKITIFNNGFVGINDTTPSFNLDVNGTFAATGNSLIGGTLNATGATTLGSTLGVTGATTLNSGLKIIGTTDIFNGQPFSTLQLIPAPTIGSTDNTIATINTTGLSFKIGTTERMKINNSGLLTVTDAATFNSGAVFNENSNDSDFRVESLTNTHMVFVDANTDRVGIGTNAPDKTLHVNGEVKIATVTATPTALLGKDGSNVVGEVATVAQTGLFGRGSVTNAVTDANGNITVAHGFSFTPIMAFANLPGSTANIVNVKEVDGTNIVFVVRDGATNDVLNTQSVSKIEFFAIK